MIHCDVCGKTCLIENNLFWCVNHPTLFTSILPFNWYTQPQHNQLSQSVTVWTTTAYESLKYFWEKVFLQEILELYMASSKLVSDSVMRLDKGFDQVLSQIFHWGAKATAFDFQSVWLSLITVFSNYNIAFLKLFYPEEILSVLVASGAKYPKREWRMMLLLLLSSIVRSLKDRKKVVITLRVSSLDD